MSSTASAAGDVLPALPPIRTTAAASPPRAEDARSSSPASSSTAPDAESRPAEKWEEAARIQEEAKEPTTPTSEESRLHPPTECPPAPRKPAWVAPPLPPTTPAKRKLPSPSAPPPPPRRSFFPVARDLSAVFRALPPKKRIRAG